MAQISLTKARRIIRAALTAGEERGFQPLAVVVVDAGGHPIAFERSNGASSGRFRIALGKCTGALGFGVDSRQIAEMAAERPTFVAALGEVIDGGAIPSPGGVIVRTQRGEVLGAVGASGDTGDNDEICVIEGLKAAGFIDAD